MLQPGTELHGFTVRSTEDLAEIDGRAIVMDHSASGAKLLYLQNDDENKAFSITFKTTPADDTGVFHILEHSVLCGSEKFPVKEPFVNLLRTSMQTFLNAMTFSDKTMYPVASTNEADLLNLVDVYLDAVLNPMLHRDKHIFEQEGWHYEVLGSNGSEDEQDRGAEAAGGTSPQDDAVQKKLVYNGVVFNEMKGSLADPENVLYHAVNKALFPDTCYAYESGGRPRAIPQLGYENYCDTHARHYRLDNSYIVLYGDLDIDRMLAFLDSNYLGPASKNASKSVVGEPNPIGTITAVRSFNNVVEMATSPDNALVGIGYTIGSSHDFEQVLAADILMDALMGGNEAPIKRAVLDAGLGGDCTAYLFDAQKVPVAFFLLKNAKPNVAQQFRELVEGEVRKLVEQGIPRDVLQASLAQMSFALRERDRGMADGVMLAINAMSGWLYDNEDATTYLHYEEPIAHMRAGLDGRYFEDALSKLVLENDHAAMVELVPAATQDKDQEEAELAAKLAQLSAADLDAIEADVAALRVRQETPDSPEALATLPQLHVSDIGPAKPEPAMELRSDAAVPCLYHDIHTRHIDYLYWYFDLQHLAWEDVPYMTILALLLGELGTQERTAAQLDVHVRQHLGSLRFFSDVHAIHDNPHAVGFNFVVAASALSEEMEYLASIPREVWAQTQFSDAARIRDLLVQKRIALEESILSEGHTRAMSRAGSYHFEAGVLGEALGGVDFYLFLKDLIDNFDERFDSLRSHLEELRDQVFVLENCTASFTGSQEDYAAFWNLWESNAGQQALDTSRATNKADGVSGLPSSSQQASSQLCIPAPVVKREAFATPTDVCFVAKSANLGNIDYDGRWQVLGRMMGFDYLWNEVRVKGGAYGCGFRSGQNGNARFYSYRDPQLDATLARFDAAGAWLSAIEPSAEEMEGYIVSTVAAHDAPTKPRMLARRQDAAYFAKRPEGWRDHLRNTLLAVTPEKLAALAPKLDEMAQSEAVCVFGNAGIVKASSAGLNLTVLIEEA